jgi:phosphate starvation-inducible PhoH-like protein
MTEEIKFKLSSEDSSILSKVFGPVNANINQIQDSLGIKVKSRGNSFSLVGKTEAIKAGKEVIETLHLKAEKSELITPGEVHLFIRKEIAGREANETSPLSEIVVRHGDGSSLQRKRGGGF